VATPGTRDQQGRSVLEESGSPAGDRLPPTRYPTRVDSDEILRVLRAFEASGLEYVLIGATAMGFHGLVRATEDVDLLIRATPENVERLQDEG